VKSKPFCRALLATGAAAACIGTGMSVQASSHREAPFITEMPKVDNTDVYVFNSYESGRDGYVTLIANYQPFQDSYGGPNYFSMDEDALYEIHIDNNGDAIADITYQFQFNNQYRNLAVPSSTQSEAVRNPVPLINIGPISQPADANLNRVETYTVNVVQSGQRAAAQPIINAQTGQPTFIKPVDNIGQKSLPDYEAYAQQHIYDITLPGCTTPGRIFVGQRREAFYVNVGEIFDLINLNPLGARDAEQNVLRDKNITSLALEVPTSCLVNGKEPVIGTWATASLPRTQVLSPTPTLENSHSHTGPFTQVSRLGNPLVNEVVIGLPAKDRFNASAPVNDVQNFGKYVLFPTLPPLVKTLFGVPVPPTPRTDVALAFVTGVPGLNKPANVNLETLKGAGEMQRLNTSIPPNPNPQIGNLGFLDCDLAGFPNGRRPVDDVVDIELTVVEGAITPTNPNNLQTCDVSNPNNPQVVNQGAVVNDGTTGRADLFINQFPYLNTPLPGSPTEAIPTL
jgi:hypothetical protein